MSPVQPKYAITLLNLTLFTLLAYTGVTLFYRTLSNALMSQVPAVRAVGAAASTAAVDHRPDRPMDYQQIVRRNLFNLHAAAVVASVAPEAVETLKKTELQVTLRGTVTGPPERALAVIEIPRTSGQQVFRIGDMVLHATLITILREKVVLEVDGKNEVLEIDMERRPGTAPASIASQAAPQTSQPSAEHQMQVQLTRSEVEQAAQNLNQLMRQVRVRPNFTDGQPDGFSIGGITPDSFFTSAGLQNGDVIQGVDGETIQTMDDAMRFYSRLQNASQFRLDIKRQGRPVSLNFQVR